MEIRPARPRDLRYCGMLDHSYVTDRVWQMDIREENGVVTSVFREAHLPREIRVEYPRQNNHLMAGWQRRDGFFVAEEEGELCGYVALTAQPEHDIAWVGDLVVDRAFCRILADRSTGTGPYGGVRRRTTAGRDPEHRGVFPRCWLRHGSDRRQPSV